MEDKHIFSNRKLFLLLIPIIAEQFLNSLMGMADSMMVSNVGAAALSGVSLVDSINNLVVQAFNAMATGGVIICSTYIGQKDRERARDSARQVLLVSTCISVTMMILGLIFRMQLLRLIFGTVDADVMEAAGIYFLLTILSYPGVALAAAGSAIFRAQSNTRLPMNIAIASNILNVAGNALLIWGFGLGVYGAALATLISRIFSAIVLLAFLRNDKLEIFVKDYHKIRPDGGKIKRILAMGIPNGIENSMFQFGKLAIQSSVSLLGTAAIAAQSMTNIFENVNGVAGIGVGIGLMTIVGQCLGAGRKDEAIYYTKKMIGWGYIAILVSCLFTYAIAGPVTILAGMAPESRKLCLFMLGWITIVKPLLWSPSFITPYAMRAAGDVKFSMIVATLTMWLLRVTLATFLIRVVGLGAMGVWIGMFADWGVRGIIFTIRFKSNKWIHKVVS
ncbi:putative efflux protein, MATE family [Butyrivibrio hungatei DSM 14810]|uniref:Probable multidrug resistance protein NorM n=1 Tax=Butyrivibrio hungatei DSM 14810 TaxID=1121132 RepID=A0A1M7S9Y1_9FIRM|nr:MATE family efflux transporter [Butyrivibrio hungatei]SHN55281.1 putative efflux protein, MATE family [Butyrivibrio hungatei DSM 14810]